jgi:hypothetical protein
MLEEAVGCRNCLTTLGVEHNVVLLASTAMPDLSQQMIYNMKECSLPSSMVFSLLAG